MIAIVKCCGNNFASIQFALERLGATSIVTNDVTTIQAASHVILPGVGFAATAMQRLKELNLDKIICNLKQPVLGICLGMQLLYQHSEEGNIDCLGIIDGTIKKMSDKNSHPLPHMGWNTIEDKSNKNNYAYFVHSYCAPINKFTTATTTYTESFSSMVQHNNFTGMQFHPERSGSYGEKLLSQFLEMRLI